MSFEIGSQRSERYLSEMMAEARGCLCCMAASDIDIGGCRLHLKNGVNCLPVVVVPQPRRREDTEISHVGFSFSLKWTVPTEILFAKCIEALGVNNTI